MNISSKKAETISIVGFSLSLLFFILTLVLGVGLGLKPIYLLSWQLLAGVLVWLVLIIQFHQRHLAEQEKLDLDQLKRSKQQDSIFEGNADRMAIFAVQGKRLAVLEKWFVPIASLVIALYEIIIGLLLFKYKVVTVADWAMRNPLLGAMVLILVSFICFLISRFATGMCVEDKFKPLRAGGSYLLATAILGFAVSISLALAQFKYVVGVTVVSYIIPWFMVVLGAEAILSLIFDVYRPRVPGQYSRSAIDSRLLGIINEPGGIFQTFAHTMDYQFGFQVSQTWFYKLLEKAILPLVLFSVLTMYLMSCIVIVGPGQEAVIEHLGAVDADQGGRYVSSGLTFKWPWPFDKIYKYPVDQIQTVNVGFVVDEETTENKPLLWGKKHYKEEYDLLVATHTDSDREQQGAIPVSLVRANVPVHYKIKDLKHYIYNHKDAGKSLEAICYRELMRFAVSAKIEIDEDGQVAGESKSLLGAGRMTASALLKKRIQSAADKAKLGIEIVFLGLQGVHPPEKVAEDYQNVIASVQEKQANVLEAIAEQNKVLTELGGSVEDVDKLYALARAFEESKDSGDTQKTEAFRVQLLEAFAKVRGDIFKTLSEAGSYAFEKATLAKATGERFGSQVKAYRASPEIYQKLQRLLLLEETLTGIRKYVVVAEEEDLQVYIVDLQDKAITEMSEIQAFGIQ